jgi:hypothetical protein
VDFGLWGDLNGSGSVNVADALCGVLTVLAIQAPGVTQWPACLAAPSLFVDADCSGAVTLSDTVLLVYAAIGAPLPAPIDSDPEGAPDGCPDACTPCVPPTEASCLISGVCVGQLAQSPANPCLECNPATSTTSFSPRADGSACGGGKICASGACVATVPQAPTVQQVTPGNLSLTVAFQAPASDGGSPVTLYRAVCDDGGAAAEANAAFSPIVVTGLTAASPHLCRVAASNAVGEGPFSVAMSGTPFGAPAAPNSLVATPGVEQISLAFVPGANNGATISGFTASCTSSTGGVTVMAASTSSPIVVPGASAGATYTCTLTATNAAGTSAPSAPSNAVVPVGLPGAPTAVVATPTVGQLSVAFGPAAANGSAVTAYTATCTSSNGGATVQGTAAGSPVVVTNATHGATYTCVVRATNGVGQGPSSASSAPVIVPSPPVHASCFAWLQAGATTSGLYTVDTDGAGPQQPFQVYCDMTNDGGGWTLIFRDTNTFDSPESGLTNGWVGSQGATEAGNLGLLAINQDTMMALAPNSAIRLQYDNLAKQITRVCRRNTNNWWYLGDNVIHETNMGSCPGVTDTSFSPTFDIQFFMQLPENESGVVHVSITQNGFNNGSIGCPSWTNRSAPSGQLANFSTGTAGAGDMNAHNGGGCFGVPSIGPHSGTAYVR